MHNLYLIQPHILRRVEKIQDVSSKPLNTRRRGSHGKGQRRPERHHGSQWGLEAFQGYQ